MSPPATRPEPSPSSSPSSTRSSPNPSEASDDLLTLARRLTEAVERLVSKFEKWDLEKYAVWLSGRKS
jgi:hypothetical protein